MKRLLFIIGLLFITSCDDIVEVPDISSATITVLAPADGVTLTTTSVTFNWDGIEDADGYRLQIATPNFAAAQQIVTDSLTPSLSIIDSLQVGAYEWRVRAENSEYQSLYTTQSFTIEE